MGPERVAEALEAVRSDRMTSHAAAKTSDIFVGSPQKHVNGSASKASRRSLCSPLVAWLEGDPAGL